MAPFQKILVATDFSECSQPAIELAGQLAQRMAAKLHVLHTIVDPAVFVIDPTALPAEAMSEMLAERESQTHLQLRKTAAMLPNSASVVQALRQGSARDEIVRYANENDMDLIVIGTHGRSGIGRLVLGSVAEGVVRLADCPVLTVRSKEPA